MADEDTSAGATTGQADDPQSYPAENAPLAPLGELPGLLDPASESNHDAGGATPLDQAVERRIYPPTLFALCIRAIGKQLKSFCNTRLYPPTCPPLTKAFEEAIGVYDLAPLALLDEQRATGQIRATKTSKLKALRAKLKAPCKQYRLEFVPAFALSPSLDHESLRPLNVLLGMLPSPEFQFRAPEKKLDRAQRLRKLESQWVSGEENQPPENVTPRLDDLPAKDGKPTTTDAIKLTRKTVTNIGCGFVAERLVSCPTLVELSLQNCQIACAGAVVLANALAISLTLRRLDLSNDDGRAFRGHSFDNDIRNVGAATLGLALETNRSLVHLSLSCNHVGQRGGSALAKMLHTNVTLRQLDLNKTVVGDAAEELIETFRWSTTLNTLKLEWCGLRPGLGTQLAAIQAAKTIQETPGAHWGE